MCVCVCVTSRRKGSECDVTVMVADKHKYRIVALVSIGVLFHLLGRVSKLGSGEQWW